MKGTQLASFLVINVAVTGVSEFQQAHSNNLGQEGSGWTGPPSLFARIKTSIGLADQIISLDTIISKDKHAVTHCFHYLCFDWSEVMM